MHRCYQTHFMLSSAETKVILLINVKMPTTVQNAFSIPWFVPLYTEGLWYDRSYRASAAIKNTCQIRRLTNVRIYLFTKARKKTTKSALKKHGIKLLLQVIFRYTCALILSSCQDQCMIARFKTIVFFREPLFNLTSVTPVHL